MNQPEIRNHLCFFFILLFFPLVVNAQGPWVRHKRAGYIQIGTNFIGPYRQIFAGDGDFLDLNRKVNDQTYSLYAEYGLGKKLTLIGNLPFKNISTTETDFAGDFSLLLPSGHITGIGNYSLTAKYSLVKNILAGLIRIEGPGSTDQNTGLNTGYDALTIVPSLSLGSSIGSVYGYLCTGYAFRNNDYNNDLILNGEIGVRMAKKKLFLIGVLDIKQNLSEGIELNSALQTGLYAANQEYISLGIKALYKLSDNFGAVIYVFGAPSGKNVAAAPSIGGSVYYEWGKK